MERPLKIGTRASALARWQANWVADQLAVVTGVRPELVLITTPGDERSGAGPLVATEQGIFTKAIQLALLDHQIDLAVHSLKDLPTEQVPGLVLGAVPPRESAADVLVTCDHRHLADLPADAAVGTGSLRRRANLLHARADLRMADIRGNVDTRLAKLDSGQYAAIVLAEAGLRRLGLESRVTEVLSHDIMLPAVGQGALGIEARADDVPTLAILQQLDHPPSHIAVVAERTFLEVVGGGCLAPIGAWATIADGQQLTLRGTVCSADGRIRLDAHGDELPTQPEALGRAVANDLLKQGAADLIRASRAGT